MIIDEPISFDTDIIEAHEYALKEQSPVYLSINTYVDDRGWSFMNQLHGVLRKEGQINYSITYPGTIKAWHRHTKQTDFWICTNGHLKAGIHREDDMKSWSMILGYMHPCVLIIPPFLWHGAATMNNEPAGLLYYVTHGYDKDNPDEERRPFDSVDFSWQIQNR